MDIRFTEEQEIMKQSARDFLASRFPKSLARQIVQGEQDFPKELWREMSDLGWTGLVIPEEYGGAGGSFLSLVVLLEEMGRACIQSPFFSTAVLGGLILLEAGNHQQRQYFLPRIANGDVFFTLALSEPEADYDPHCIAVKAKLSGDSYTINGVKLFVPDADIADYIICAARTKESTVPEDGITLFILDGKTRGLSCSPLKTISGDSQCEVIFDKVKVPKNSVLGEVNKGWNHLDVVLQKAAVAKCAEMAGGAQQVLDMTVAYAKERVQFGKPIGAFQAIQHHCANMLIDVEGCRWVTYKAAWMIEEDIPYKQQAAIAKAWCNQAYRRVVALGHQVLGGVGYTLDHDMPLYFRHARTAEVTFGDVDYHQEIVADGLYSR
jgi:alkylation response protein AidB-like acyl-CoA dehydrogenase